MSENSHMMSNLGNTQELKKDKRLLSASSDENEFKSAADLYNAQLSSNGSLKIDNNGNMMIQAHKYQNSTRNHGSSLNRSIKRAESSVTQDFTIAQTIAEFPDDLSEDKHLLKRNPDLPYAFSFQPN